MPKTFVIGDIHGAYHALKQCLERSSFDYKNDHLISLGDVADGWPDTKLCVDELLTISHLTYVLGNHDFWTLDWMENAIIDEVWFKQGGKATIDSYEGHVPDDHKRLLQQALPYYIDDRRLFVHAGINPDVDIEKQTIQTFLWSRDLAKIAYQAYLAVHKTNITVYKEVYIGHTPVAFAAPIQGAEVWMMDTGAGWAGVLSMMNIETKEVFTSDEVNSLYPGIEGRQRR